MAASDFDFLQTRNQIIERAFRIVGATSVDDTLTAGQLDQGAVILNTIVQAWQARRTFLWTVKTFNDTLVNGLASYPLPDDPPLQHIYSGSVVIDDVSYPLRQMSFTQYQGITTKEETGQPQVFAVDHENIYVWPVPDGTYYFAGVGVMKLEDWDLATSTGGFSSEWIRALTYAVAADLASEYGLPSSEKKNLEATAEMAFRTARNSGGRKTSYQTTKGLF